MPRVQRHGDERQGLGQANEPERERIARQGEDLPADDDDLRLAPNGGEGVAEEQPDEVLVAEGGVGVVQG
jgi:hypothetical protein